MLSVPVSKLWSHKKGVIHFTCKTQRTSYLRACRPSWSLMSLFISFLFHFLRSFVPVSFVSDWRRNDGSNHCLKMYFSAVALCILASVVIQDTGR